MLDATAKVEYSMTNSRPAHLDRVVSHLLTHCGNLAAGETVVIVGDTETAGLSRLFEGAARELGGRPALFIIPPAPVHGTEPPAHVAEAMASAQLILGLTRMSMAHTAARCLASRQGARYLSLPEYSENLLHDPALMADYRAREPKVRQLADAFTAGSRARVMTRAGTDIRLDLRGRVGNCCPGCVTAPGSLGSPPDIEANISPVETGSEGVAVIDGSIPYPGLGLLQQPVTLTVAGGRIVDFACDDAGLLERVRTVFARVGSDKAYVLAELGVGMNELATLTGIMLTDEGAANCLHFGFGSNATVGGVNDVPFHLDFVFRDATLTIDDRVVIQDGVILP